MTATKEKKENEDSYSKVKMICAILFYVMTTQKEISKSTTILNTQISSKKILFFFWKVEDVKPSNRLYIRMHLCSYIYMTFSFRVLCLQSAKLQTYMLSSSCWSSDRYLPWEQKTFSEESSDFIYRLHKTEVLICCNNLTNKKLAVLNTKKAVTPRVCHNILQ